MTIVEYKQEYTPENRRKHWNKRTKSELVRELMNEQDRNESVEQQLREKESRIARLEQAISDGYDSDKDSAQVLDYLVDVLNETPQQSLAHIQADAVEEAITSAQPSCYTIRGLGNMLSEATLYRYAQKLRDKANGDSDE